MRRPEALVLVVFLSALLAPVLPGILGHVAAYLAIAVLPGLAVSQLLLGCAPRRTRHMIGIALGPLSATVLAWVGMAAGLSLAGSTRAVIVVGLLGLAVATLRQPRDAVDGGEGPPLDRVGWSVLIGSVIWIALPAVFNPWTRIHSDSWIHAGIAWDIHEHGIPPIDPRFAGLRLSYVWFYNFLLAMVSTTRADRDPFITMVLMNLVDMGLLVGLTWTLAAWRWQSAMAARGAVLLLTFGLNAGAWLLWPLRLLRAAFGEHRGWSEVARIAGQGEWDSYRVMLSLSAPFAWMVNHWDKWTIGSSIGYTYLFVPLHLFALVRAWETRRAAWWSVVVAASAGMMLFHGVVGLSVVPVSLTALVALRIGARAWPDGATLRQAAAGLLALATGALLTLPYLRSITAGWSAGESGLRHSYLHFDGVMPWTILTSCGVALVFAWRSHRTSAHVRRPHSDLLVVWSIAMTGFACIIHLPEGNEHKFVWPLFAILAVCGGPTAWAWWATPRSGIPRAVFVGLVVLVFLVPPALFLNGMLRDRAERSQPELAEVANPQQGDMEFFRWVRDSTSRDAVMLDDKARDHLMVLGRRRLLAGTLFGTDRAAFPSAELAERRAIQADLFGPVTDPVGAIASLRRSLQAARARQAVSEALIVYRRNDHSGPPARWELLEQSVPGVERVRDRDGFVVLRVPIP